MIRELDFVPNDDYQIVLISRNYPKGLPFKNLHTLKDFLSNF